MDYVAVIAVEVLNAIATLVLVSIGLAVIFGMMRVINLAHGEFIMLGGYAATMAVKWGIDIWLSMLVVAPLAVGLAGAVLERLVIRHLYGRMLDAMLATWGLSLLLVGLTTAFFGTTTQGVQSPLGATSIGSYSVSLYAAFVITMAAVVCLLLYVLLRHTHFGLRARSVMQNASMAAALGMHPKRTYAVTFALGAALAGLAGGILAPITGVVPTIGVAYVAKAFITVIGGGTSILAGTVAASTVFGTVNQLVSFVATPVIGEVALLAVAMVLIRLLPQGITGRFFRGRI